MGDRDGGGNGERDSVGSGASRDGDVGKNAAAEDESGDLHLGAADAECPGAGTGDSRKSVPVAGTTERIGGSRRWFVTPVTALPGPECGAGDADRPPAIRRRCSSRPRKRSRYLYAGSD